MNSARLYKKFSKPELLELADELGISISDGTSVKMLTKVVLDDIDQNGIPDEDDCSDLMYDFLIEARFIDEDGEIIDEEDFQEEHGGDSKDDVEDVETDAETVEELPHCFGYADDRDPACNRCKVYDMCLKDRIAYRENNLPCFGIMYDMTAAECKRCLEAGPCRTKMQRR